MAKKGRATSSNATNVTNSVKATTGPSIDESDKVISSVTASPVVDAETRMIDDGHRDAITPTVLLPSMEFRWQPIEKFLNKPTPNISGMDGGGAAAATLASDLVQSLSHLRKCTLLPRPEKSPHQLTLMALIARFNEVLFSLDTLLNEGARETLRDLNDDLITMNPDDLQIHGANDLLYDLTFEFSANIGSFSDAVCRTANRLYFCFLGRTDLEALISLEAKLESDSTASMPTLCTLSCYVSWNAVVADLGSTLDKVPKLESAMKLELENVIQHSNRLASSNRINTNTADEEEILAGRESHILQALVEAGRPIKQDELAKLAIGTRQAHGNFKETCATLVRRRMVTSGSGTLSQGYSITDKGRRCLEIHQKKTPDNSSQ